MSNKKQQQIISNNENISQIDSFLTELTKGICFSGIPHAKEYERQQNLLQSVQIFKRLHIAVPSNGLNLHLTLNSSRIISEQNEVHFQSDFFFNGIPVRIKGQINIITLLGVAQAEQIIPINSQILGCTTYNLINDCKIQINSNEAEKREKINQRLNRIRETILRI